MRSKRKRNKRFFAAMFLLVLLSLFYLPAGTLADTVGGTPASSRLVPCGGPVGSDYADPCTLCHFIIGFHNLVQYGLFWVVTFALVGIFISGLIYIISAGDEGLMTKAKGFMKACLIGFVVVAGSWMIVNTTILVLGAKNATSAGGTLGIGITNWFTFTCNPATNQGVVPGGAPSASPAPVSPAPVRVGDPCTGIAPVGNRSGTCQSLTGTGGSAATARVCPNRSWSLQQITSEPRQCSSASLGCCDMSAANANTAPGIQDAPCGAGNAGTCLKVTGTFLLPASACASLTPQRIPVSGGSSCQAGLWCCASPGGGSPSPPPMVGP